ncbi:MAG: outer membrane protein transport protein [Rhodanobacteraceae bacterium]
MNQTLRFAICAALALTAVPAFALTDSETNASIPFSFSSPGARSLGMGGAFIGLADDATAAYTNPAGLTQPRQTEISAEVRHSSYSLPFVDGGTAVIDSNGFDASGLHHSDANSSKNNLSFLSVLFPHDRWAVAFYRHEVLNYESNFASTGAIASFPELTLNDGNGNPICSPDVGTCQFALFPFAAHSSLRIVNYGASAAWKINDQLSLGAGLSYYDFSISTTDTRLNVDSSTGVSNGNPINMQVQHGNDSGIGASVGLRYQLTDQWSLGLVYRHAPSFSYKATNTGFNDDGTTVPVASLSSVDFNVPDSYGLGLSYRPAEALLVNLDVDRVRYSELSSGIQSLFRYTDANGNALPNDASNLRVSDGTEVHLGAEYTFLTAHPVNLRAGIWHDPAHSLQYRGASGDGSTNQSQGQVALATLFSQGRGSQTHYAGGLGVAFSKFQVDFGFDLSADVDIYSLSGVFRF